MNQVDRAKNVIQRVAQCENDPWDTERFSMMLKTFPTRAEIEEILVKTIKESQIDVVLFHGTSPEPQFLDRAGVFVGKLNSQDIFRPLSATNKMLKDEPAVPESLGRLHAATFGVVHDWHHAKADAEATGELLKRIFEAKLQVEMEAVV